ncbi:MAG: type II toxin-antitoxin system RelE/ParE family toxin [Prevotella sp.]|jgi:toxin ParE1/3/4|nr:type II toxin-antitoxin system RelE/ParE family toxin [Prevotella sp.]
MNPYTISKKATEDLEQIWRYTYFQWSEEQADKYYHLLIEKIALIAQNTTIGRKIDYIRTGYRCFPVESHTIFYKISKNAAVTIIRILHQRMDAPSHL